MLEKQWWQGVELLVTGRQSKREIDDDEAESPVIGLVHGFNSKLQDSLPVFCKTNAPKPCHK